MRDKVVFFHFMFSAPFLFWALFCFQCEIRIWLSARSSCLSKSQHSHSTSNDECERLVRWGSPNTDLHRSRSCCWSRCLSAGRPNRNCNRDSCRDYNGCRSNNSCDNYATFDSCRCVDRCLDRWCRESGGDGVSRCVFHRIGNRDGHNDCRSSGDRGVLGCVAYLGHVDLSSEVARGQGSCVERLGDWNFLHDEGCGSVDDCNFYTRDGGNCGYWAEWGGSFVCDGLESGGHSIWLLVWKNQDPKWCSTSRARAKEWQSLKKTPKRAPRLRTSEIKKKTIVLTGLQ